MSTQHTVVLNLKDHIKLPEEFEKEFTLVNQRNKVNTYLFNQKFKIDNTFNKTLEFLERYPEDDWGYQEMFDGEIDEERCGELHNPTISFGVSLCSDTETNAVYNFHYIEDSGDYKPVYYHPFIGKFYITPIIEEYEINTNSAGDVMDILSDLGERFPNLFHEYVNVTEEGMSNDLIVIKARDMEFVYCLFKAVKDYKNDYVWVEVDGKYVENEEMV